MKRLYKNDEGIAFVEFALILPVLIIIFVGAIELSNYVYARQKLQSAVANIGNIVSLQQNVSRANLEVMADMLPNIVRPMEARNYGVIVTAIQRDITFPSQGTGPGYVHWQESFGAGGASTFGFSACGDKSVLVNSSALNGFVFSEGEQIIMVEAYMRYNAVISDTLMGEVLGLDNNMMYEKSAPFRPRTGSFQFCPGDLV